MQTSRELTVGQFWRETELAEGGEHSFVQQIFVEHLLCTLLDTWDQTMMKTDLILTFMEFTAK